MRLWTFTLSHFFLLSAFALPESRIPSSYEELLDYRSLNSRSYLVHVQPNLALHYRAYYRGETPTEELLMVLPGTAEAEMQYLELAYDLQDLAMDLVIMDHRGHGLSDPPSHGQPPLIHIESFFDYNRDSAELMKRLLEKRGYTKIHILATSLGAHVALALIAYYPTLPFGHITLVSPLLSSHWADPFLHTYLSLVRGIWGREPFWSPGFVVEFDRPFRRNPSTTSQARFDLLKHLSEDFPHLIRGLPTNTWMQEMIQSSWDLSEQLLLIDTPFQMVGEISERARGICSHAVNCRMHNVRGARSNLFWEADQFRDPLLAQYLSELEEI